MVNNQLDCLQYLWQLACQSSAMAWYQHRLRRMSIIRIIHIIHVIHFIHYPHVFTQAHISGPFQHQYQPQQLGQVTLLTEISFLIVKFIFFNWSILSANAMIFFRHLGVCHADDLFYMWGHHYLYLVLWWCSTIIIIAITMTSIIIIITMTSIIINIIITCTCGTCTASTLSLVFSTTGGLKTTKSTQKGSAPCFRFQAQIQQIWSSH